MDVHYIPGVQNSTDLLTKPLKKIIHLKWLKHICLHVSQSSLSEEDVFKGGC